MRTALVALSAVILVAGCGREPEQTPAAARPAPAEPAEEEPVLPADAPEITGEWVLVTLGGEPIVGGLKPPTLTVMPDGRIAGFAGVNRYMGHVGNEEGKLFGPMPTTMMAGPPEAMALERRFTAAMTEAAGYELAGDTLTIAGETDALVFERVAE